jgi:hypothetical protein
MQNTRLSTLVDSQLRQLTRWLQNPWRRLSLIIISLLFGNFLASIVSTVAGQSANQDTFISVTLVALIELISWLTYGSAIGRRPTTEAMDAVSRPFWLDVLNGTKLGFTYGLFVEAFKLGS